MTAEQKTSTFNVLCGVAKIKMAMSHEFAVLTVQQIFQCDYKRAMSLIDMAEKLISKIEEECNKKITLDDSILNSFS